MKISDLMEARSMKVVYYDRFLNALSDYVKRNRNALDRVTKKIDEFLDAKSANPLQRFGTSDSTMSGPMTGYRHFHVSRNPDIVVIYSMAENKIHLIDIVDHDIIQKSRGIANHAPKLNQARPVKEE